MILVTKTFLPVRASFEKYVDKIYSSHWLTNFGSLEQELTSKLKDFLEVDNILLTSNGTLALQVAYKVLGLTGEVITTPFSFVATASSLVWEGLKPVFCDIDCDTLNLDPRLIEDKISNATSAILPTHVFGRACAVERIQKIADQYKLKVIYDAAHAFNVRMKHGKNILNYGDISTLSFHATKIFHTIEGGAIISRDSNVINECKRLINFGFVAYDKIKEPGINAKMNEFSAAMGLAVLENMDYIIAERERVDTEYRRLLPQDILLPVISYATNNFSYFPILLKDEEHCIKIRNALIAKGIMPRRYFYPSLDTLDYAGNQCCPVSRNIAGRILCLPMYDSIQNDLINKIASVVNSEFVPAI